ncbi:MAG UNVERIFIED_CONTAM: hypothetical protein LVR18_14030 [Planctomycetaceae bacterium]
MNSRCRLQLLPFLTLACICWLGLSGSSSVFASCGDYLHSRLGAPKQTIPGGVTADLLAAKVGDIGLKDVGDVLPKPCSGPNCSRPSVPPLLPPASAPSGSRGWDEQGFTVTWSNSASSARDYAQPEQPPSLLVADLAPLDTPPDCCPVARRF